jgi:hypothetical protein
MQLPRCALLFALAVTSGCLGFQDYDFRVGSGPDGGLRDGATPDAPPHDAGMWDGAAPDAPFECDRDDDGFPIDPVRCEMPEIAADCDDGAADVFPWAPATCGDGVRQSCPAGAGLPIELAELGLGAPMRVTDVATITIPAERQVSLLLRPPPILGAAGAQAAVLWHEDEAGVKVARIRAFDIGGPVHAAIDLRTLAPTLGAPELAPGDVRAMRGARMGRVLGRSVLGMTSADATGWARLFADLDAETPRIASTNLEPSDYLPYHGLMTFRNEPAFVRVLRHTEILLVIAREGQQDQAGDLRLATATWLVADGGLALTQAGSVFAWDGVAASLAPIALPPTSERPALASLGDTYLGVLNEDAAGYTLFRLACPAGTALAACVSSLVTSSRTEDGRHLFALAALMPELGVAAFAQPGSDGEEVAIAFVQGDGTWLEESVHPVLGHDDVGGAFTVEDLAIVAETVRGATTILVAAVLRDEATGAASLWARTVALCASDACLPFTCEELGRSCGSVGDGCGDTLACGDCSELSSSCGTGVCSERGTCGLTPINEGNECVGATADAHHCASGYCVADAGSILLSEVSGATPDFIELVNRGSAPALLDGLTLTFTDDAGQKSYAVPSGILLQPGGVWRVHDDDIEVRPNEAYFGAQLDWGNNGAWVELCRGACAADCSNVLDYVVVTTGVAPTGMPTCTTFTPAPVAGGTGFSSQSLQRIGFTGALANGLASDWVIDDPSRNP